MTRILITGKDSFIGTSVEKYLSRWNDLYQIDTIDMTDNAWRGHNFSAYDVVFHVAGIAHADTGRLSDAQRAAYYRINTDLTLEAAAKAKAAGVSQFIFMSSAIVYGDSAPIGQTKRISGDTPAAPASCYGDSKLRAEEGLLAMGCDTFRAVVLRPPMVYGPGCKGNYPLLARLARRLPFFPETGNERSILYIENLAEFVRLMIENREQGVFHPQNDVFVSTAGIARAIADAHGRKLPTPRGFIRLMKLAGRFSGAIRKAFGSLSYTPELSAYREGYQVCSFEESIRRTEGCETHQRALLLASVASMIDQFNMSNLRLLKELGYQVDVVANFERGNTFDAQRTEALQRELAQMGVRAIHMPIPRSIGDIRGILASYRQVKALCAKRRYALMHCQSPIGGVIARLAARASRRRFGTRVVYTAHGFHFYKGAPLSSWLLFYPIEKLCAPLTDVLVTINQEDCVLARKKLRAGRVEYVPGVGIDPARFTPVRRDDKRRALGFGPEDTVILSVGELNENKNHLTAIRALGKVPCEGLHYVIAGIGGLEEQLREEAAKQHVQLHLLGFRTDVHELLGAADLFLLPSRREGLSVSLMEAMASGLPCVASRIRGNVDLIEDGRGGYLCPPEDADAFADAVTRLLTGNQRAEMGRWNREKISGFSLDRVASQMKEIYAE